MTYADLRRISLATSSFYSLRIANQIYVDKTALVYDIASCRDKIFLSRPRRFGKTLLVSTFERLFKCGLEDFKGLAIERLWTDKIYNVVRLDFSELRQFADIQKFKTKFSQLLADQFGLIGFAAESEAPVISLDFSSEKK